MPECIQKFFFRNGLLLESTLFDESFLSKPHYIYEVFRVIDGLPLFIEDHLERLKQTVALSSLPDELVPADFEQQVQRLIEAINLQEGNIKVVMLPAENEQEAAFLIYIMEHQYPSAAEFENGVELALHYGVRENPNAKVMDVELRSNTNQIKKKQLVYETLLVDQDHCITEGSRSNVFFVLGDEVITPPLADVLPGVTRKHVMKLCSDLNIPLREEKVHEYSLGQMDAVFITGTSRKVLPAFRIDEWLYPPDHPIVRQLQAAFNQEVENYLQSKKQESDCH
jgi:branched-chain amino acid aminotransferase